MSTGPSAFDIHLSPNNGAKGRQATMAKEIHKVAGQSAKAE
jgi:hypothetical protein